MNLDAWSDWLTARTGINLTRGAVGVFRAYVERRSRALGLDSPEAYRKALEQQSGAEFQKLVDALTVTHTWFFRDPEQLEALGVLMQRAAERAAGRPLQVWTAGCASGEETYTVALIAKARGIEAQVLGTDLNSAAIQRAREGRFGAWACRAVPATFLDQFVRTDQHGFEIRDPVKRAVRFSVHNLLASPCEPPGGGGWDFILCRNVLIYFTSASSRSSLDALGTALSPGGYLLLGASDVLLESPPRLVPETVAGRIVFRRATGRFSAPRWPGRLSSRPPRAGHWKSVAPPLVKPGPADPVIAAPRAPLPGESPSLAEGHRLLGLGDLDGALRQYTLACEEDPVSSKARLYAGMAHYLVGDLPAALHCLRGSLLLDDECWPASYYLAASLEALGLAPEARREYQRAAHLCERVKGAAFDIPGSPLYGLSEDLAWLAKKRAGKS